MIYVMADGHTCLNAFLRDLPCGGPVPVELSPVQRATINVAACTDEKFKARAIADALAFEARGG